MNQILRIFRLPLLIFGVLVLAGLLLTACKGRPPEVIPTPTQATKAALIQQELTQTPTVTASPTPTSTPFYTATPVATITPNFVINASALVTAIPAKGEFQPPEVEISVIAFDNQTPYLLGVTVDPLGEPIQVASGSLVERFVAPGSYHVSITIAGQAEIIYQEDLTLETHTRLTLPLTEGTLAFKNQTDAALNITLEGTNIHLNVPPRSTSQAVAVAPGAYTYNALPVGQNAIQTPVSATGSIGLGDGITITIEAVDLQSSLVILNQTKYPMTVKIKGMADEIEIQPGGRSTELVLKPGSYTYEARSQGDISAPLTGEIDLTSGFMTTLTLTFGGDRAEVTFKNDTNCALNLRLEGPDTLEKKIPAYESITVNITSGFYNYTISGCNATGSFTDTFSGIDEVRFYFE